MRCPNCERENPEDARYCAGCGVSLSSEIACRRCGRLNPPDAAFCNGCGQQLNAASPTAEGAINRAPTSVAAPQPSSFASGRYVVKRFLGEGGKKKVYLAHDASLDRDVAFALIKTEGLDEAARERITREAQAMGRLGTHPNIVPIFDIGEEFINPGVETPGMRTTQPYLVLPVMSGGDVEGLIDTAPEHKLPIEQAIKIAVETCMGLEFVHGKGIVHRDLKPGNVWLMGDEQTGRGADGQGIGRAMIGDFGLAVATDRTRLTQAGMMVGTVSYMPPEQAMGGEITPRSDLYALGAMLYELVCGRPPFVGDESVAIIGQHLNTPPVAPTWHRPDCPLALEVLILRLLEKDPGKRPESALEVRQALEAVSRADGQTGRRAAERAEKSLLPAGKGGRRPDEGPPAQPATPDPLYRRTFVGREHEVRQLQQAFDAAMSGNGALVMVVGEPGIGKTALCEQLATYVALRGGKALVGHCYEEGSLSLPYLAFVEAMRSYVLAREPDGLRSDLGTGAADVARIVSEVRDRVNVELRPAGDPEDDRWRLLQAITSFLRNASTVQPMAIVLEDLHWADRGTLDLLLHVARNLQGARLLIVGTYRDVEVDRTHPLSGVLAELRRQERFLRVPLRGLTIDEVHRMYEALRGNEVAWAQAELVHRQTEGNPLFVQEVLRYLVEEGFVVRQGGSYVPQQGAAQAVPEGLRDVVGRRLSHLSEKANHVLSVAAVIGRDFRLDVLQRVVALGEEDVIAALEEAQGRAIIEDYRQGGSLGFRFTHAFFRQTLYEEIFAPRRIRLHQQVGRALEEVHARRLDEHATELAEHFTQSTESSDLQKAVHYGELAAQRSMGVFAYSEAVRHLEQALRAHDVLDSSDDLKQCDLLIALAQAQLPSGNGMRVTDQIAPQAFALAQGLNDKKRSAHVGRLALEGVIRARFLGTGFEPVLRVWVERIEHSASEGDVELVFAKIARARLIQANHPDRLALIDSAFELARKMGDSDVMFLAAWNVMFASLTSGRWKKAAEVFDSLRHESRAMVGSRNLSLYLQFGSVKLLQGEREVWDELGRELEGLAERTRDANIELSARGHKIQGLLMDGSLEEASHLAEESLAFAIERGIAFAPVALPFAQASGYLGLTVRIPEGVVVPTPGIGGRRSTPFFLIGSFSVPPFEMTISEEETRSALDALWLGESVSGDVGLQPLAVLLIGSLALQDKERLKAILDAPVPPESAAFSLPAGMFSIARLCGAAAMAIDEVPRARLLTEKAITECEDIRHRPELALARLQLAELLLEHYPDEREAAIEHLDFAISEFREMKMQPSLERALRHRGLLKA